VVPLPGVPTLSVRPGVIPGSVPGVVGATIPPVLMSPPSPTSTPTSTPAPGSVAPLSRMVSRSTPESLLGVVPPPEPSLARPA
jgi:hypothetical protein